LYIAKETVIIKFYPCKAEKYLPAGFRHSKEVSSMKIKQWIFMELIEARIVNKWTIRAVSRPVKRRFNLPV